MSRVRRSTSAEGGGMTRLWLGICAIASTALTILLAGLWIQSDSTDVMCIFGHRHSLASWKGGIHYYRFSEAMMETLSFAAAPVERDLEWDGAQYRFPDR